MMNFKEMLLRAQARDPWATEKLLSMYQPLLLKESIVNGMLDEDLFQELSIVLLRSIKHFRI